jgi:ABC-type uncharacterized transport system fused permease/ATPase subunit
MYQLPQISICFLLWVHEHVLRLWLADELLICWDNNLLATLLEQNLEHGILYFRR